MVVPAFIYHDDRLVISGGSFNLFADITSWRGASVIAPRDHQNTLQNKVFALLGPF